MFIEGDVVNDSATFEWILFRIWEVENLKAEIVVNLTEGDGEKVVKVKFRNAVKIESEFVEDTIILDTTPPAVQNVQSQAVDNPQDADEHYSAGQQILIRASAKDSETELEGTIQIKSQTASYDSGLQALEDEGDGFYSYVWTTDGLSKAEDYVVETGLKDFLERETLDDSLTIQIDNIPLPQGEFVINDGQESTESRSVNLTISAENAEEMYLDGDIVDDKETFEWIDFASDKQVNLIQGDGEKIVSVKFRNSAQVFVGYIWTNRRHRLRR